MSAAPSRMPSPEEMDEARQQLQDLQNANNDLRTGLITEKRRTTILERKVKDLEEKDAASQREIAVLTSGFQHLMSIVNKIHKHCYDSDAPEHIPPEPPVAPQGPSRAEDPDYDPRGPRIRRAMSARKASKEALEKMEAATTRLSGVTTEALEAVQTVTVNKQELLQLNAEATSTKVDLSKVAAHAEGVLLKFVAPGGSAEGGGGPPAGPASAAPSIPHALVSPSQARRRLRFYQSIGQSPAVDPRAPSGEPAAAQQRWTFAPPSTVHPRDVPDSPASSCSTIPLVMPPDFVLRFDPESTDPAGARRASAPGEGSPSSSLRRSPRFRKEEKRRHSLDSTPPQSPRFERKRKGSHDDPATSPSSRRKAS